MREISWPQDLHLAPTGYITSPTAVRSLPSPLHSQIRLRLRSRRLAIHYYPRRYPAETHREALSPVRANRIQRAERLQANPKPQERRTLTCGTIERSRRTEPTNRSDKHTRLTPRSGETHYPCPVSIAQNVLSRFGPPRQCRREGPVLRPRLTYTIPSNGRAILSRTRLHTTC